DQPDVDLVQKALEALAQKVGTTLAAAQEVRSELGEARRLARELDELTWSGGVASGLENHTWLVTASDFGGDHREYERGLSELLVQARRRNPRSDGALRLAYVGVPPVFAEDLYGCIERNGARVVFNEVQRQFAMPDAGPTLAGQYCNYTYPYSVSGRVRDIVPQLRDRRVDGVIHYVQAFCHRGIGDIIFRDAIDVPILTLEGNDDFMLNNHLMTRIEAFIDMLRMRSAAVGGASLGPSTSALKQQ
ncbi:MAG: 2-hydroxyacyl-CoA dehydratase family protein, partial [Dehalococcoidia bacterium]